jgi:predicted dehydrogenase
VEFIAPGLGLWLTEHRMTVSDEEGERTVTAAVDPIAAEDRAFIGAIRGERDDIRAPYREALRTHRLAVEIAAAAARGGTVELSHEAVG